jgi:hypothetical protein
MFHLLGAQPLLGRLLGPQDDKPGGAGVAVLSYGLWKRLFGADPQVIGRSLNLNGKQVTVAGVLRPEFLLNHEVMPTVGGIDKAEILLPLPLGADAVKNRGDENYNIMARVKPGISMRQAQSDIDIIASRMIEPAAGRPIVLTDPNDDPAVYTAVAGGADVLCTMDRDFYTSKVLAFCAHEDIRVMDDLALLKIL